MNGVSACAILPDLELPLHEGAATNLRSFCGQKLVLVFCPAGDPKVMAAEMDSYRALAESFQGAGAWILVIVASPAHLPRAGGGPHIHIHIGIDKDGAIFRAVLDCLPGGLAVKPVDGLTIVIDRDGSVREAWPGHGHGRKALASARERP